MLHLLEGSLKGHITVEKEIKKPNTGQNQTHDLFVMRWALYRRAFTTAPRFNTWATEPGLSRESLSLSWL